ncbi:MAG: hypothetical protein SFY32_16985, partial [Bacteroidota bacterium]|nr:hypothetical protein [Bacteroidota bacterium]
YQDISRSGVAVTGAKNFNYFLVPKEPGKFRMKDFIMWIYFNPKTAKYDTLKSNMVLNVSGESSINNVVNVNDHNDFNDFIEKYGNHFYNSQKDEYVKWISNIALVLMFLVTLYLMIRKK